MAYPIYRIRAKRNTVIQPAPGQTMNISKGSIGTAQIVQADVPVDPNVPFVSHRSYVKFIFNGSSMTIPVFTNQNAPNIEWLFQPKPGGGYDPDFELVTVKNIVSVKNQNRESSYFGEQVVSGKEESLKDAFAVIGTLFFALILYWYVTGGPFKTIE